jgi:hypothetical protein
MIWATPWSTQITAPALTTSRSTVKKVQNPIRVIHRAKDARSLACAVAQDSSVADVDSRTDEAFDDGFVIAARN